MTLPSRNPKPDAKQPPSDWLPGTVVIAATIALFLTLAITLCFLLVTSREKFQTAQHFQTVLRQAVFLQADLDNANSAARRYLVNRKPKNVERLKALSNSAGMRVQALIDALGDDPAAAQEISTLIPSIRARNASLNALVAKPDDLATIRDARATQARLGDEVDGRLEAFRAAQNKALARHLNAADRNILIAIALALVGAVAGPALGLLGIWLLNRARDTQRIRQMQNELMHVQRLAVMGETAAMLAHDVSHPLTAANNYLGALRRTASTASFEERDKIVDLAARTATQISRASAILLRLRRFIEKREAERQLEDPTSLLSDSVALLGPLDNDVQIAIDADPSLPGVMMDRVQIQQVLVNLMRNGVEATQGCPRRRLSVSAAPVDGRFVIFSIADSGRGLPQDIAEHLFRPFVSSKSEGMGIGLTICRNIVSEHGGMIWAEKNPEGGAIFRFRLPAA